MATGSHICQVHPLLDLVSVPGSGMGYRASGFIAKGSVLLLESSFCDGPLGSGGDDAGMVDRFLERMSAPPSACYRGAALSPAALTVRDGTACGSSAPGGGVSRARAQAVLDNNVYQCRRSPSRSALFVALSRFNHSCDPNAVVDCCGETATVRALRDVRAGVEAAVSYVPVGWDLERRTSGLSGFGFRCGCGRCTGERESDPAFAARCGECGTGVRYFASDADVSASATCCSVCGDGVGPAERSGDGDGDGAVWSRHAEVRSALAALEEVVDGDAAGCGRSRVGKCRRRAESALLLAPFATHPHTLELHRGLVRLLKHGANRYGTAAQAKGEQRERMAATVREQLREIDRLERAHGPARHRDLNFLRLYAQLWQDCAPLRGRTRDGDGAGDDTEDTDDADDNTEDTDEDTDDDTDDDGAAALCMHVDSRWETLCLLHFGESAAPPSFMEWAAAPRTVPIGGGAHLALLDGDDEIDLAGRDIGDAGCAELCAALALPSHLDLSIRALDLESNAISPAGARTLADAAAGGCLLPQLRRLDLACNPLVDGGARALASALAAGAFPHLSRLDLRGVGFGNGGCKALGEAFADRAVAPCLASLDLSANDIEDCSPLRTLLATAAWEGRCGLDRLDLAENYVEDCAGLFLGSGGLRRAFALDVSWNCIAAPGFAALGEALAEGCAAFVELALGGNAFSDEQCSEFCAAVRAGGPVSALSFVSGRGRNPAPAPAGGEGATGTGRLRQCLRSLADGEAINPRLCGANDLWQVQVPKIPVGQSAVAREEEVHSFSNSSAAATISLREHLERDGYAVAPRIFQHVGGADGSGMEAISSAIERLEKYGWPPVFCLMCDAVWDLIAGPLWEEVAALLGVGDVDECVLEPSVFAWSLKRGAAQGGRIGGSFGLPHRDYPASESLSGDGKETPVLLNVWIPLTDATLDNGCMHVLPREFDPHFAAHEDRDHMRPASAVRDDAATCKLRFALHGARAVPAPAGSLLAWCGNTVHWGGSCSRHSRAPPRRSVAMTFRRRDAEQLKGAGPPITRAEAREMSSERRLALVARSLLLYGRWHVLDDDDTNVLPPAIYETTSLL